MKHIYKFLIIVAALIIIPSFANADFGATWQATSTTQQLIFPGKINGNYPAPYAPYFIASSSVATSTLTNLFLSGILTVSRQGVYQFPISGSIAQFVGLDANPLRFTFDTHNNGSTSGTALMFRRSRGTSAVPLALTTDDVLGSLNFRGYGNTGYAPGSTGLMTAKAEGQFTDTSQPTVITFDTTATGTVTAIERVRIGSAGALAFGGSYGGLGQLLQSQGTTSLPLWVSTSSIGLLSGSGINGYQVRWTSSSVLSTGVWFDNGTVSGVNATTSTSTLLIQGNAGTSDSFKVASSSSSQVVQLIVKNTGFVGIGTSSPNAFLGIQGNFGANNDMFTIATSTLSGSSTGFTIFTVKGNGNVGIGSSSPTALLSVQGGTGNSSVAAPFVLNILGAQGGSSGQGGSAVITGGTGGSGATGGDIIMTGGVGGSTVGGQLIFRGGAGTSSGKGGLATFGGGDAASTNGGDTSIISGLSTSGGAGGNITIRPGNLASGASANGVLTILGGGTNSTGSAPGGLVQIIGGTAAAGSAAKGGAVQITGGLAGNASGAGGTGGDVSVFGGLGIAGGSAGGGGNLYLYGGAPSSGTALFGNVIMAVSSSSVQSGNVGVASSTPTSRFAVNGLSGVATTTKVVTVASSSNAILFEVNGAGHIKVGGSTNGTGTTTSCGTGPVFISDNGSVITFQTGGGAPSACTVTFPTPHFTNATTTKIWLQARGTTAVGTSVSGVSSTGFTANFSTGISSTIVDALVLDSVQ